MIVFVIGRGKLTIHPADYICSVSIISSLIFAELISLDMQQINMDLQENEAPLIIIARFRNIIQMHKELLR